MSPCGAKVCSTQRLPKACVAAGADAAAAADLRPIALTEANGKAAARFLVSKSALRRKRTASEVSLATICVWNHEKR